MQTSGVSGATEYHGKKPGGRAAPKYSSLLSHLHSLGATLGDPRATFRGWRSVLLAFWSDNDDDAERTSRARTSHILSLKRYDDAK